MWMSTSLLNGQWRWFSGEFLYCLIQHQEQLSEHSTLQGRAGSLQCTLESGKGGFCSTQEEVVVCPVWELMEGITNHCFVIVWLICFMWNKSRLPTIDSRYFTSVGGGKALVLLVRLSPPYSVSWLLNISLQDVYVAVYLSRCVLVF